MCPPLELNRAFNSFKSVLELQQKTVPGRLYSPTVVTSKNRANESFLLLNLAKSRRLVRLGQ